jgi:acyl-CoA thioester hydrolase
MDLQPLPITYQAIIPADYHDEMAHMNVMWYTHLFSEAVGTLWNMVGMDRAYFESHSAGTFALEFHIRFLAEIRAGQQITIRPRLLARTAKRLHFIQFMFNDTRSVLSCTEETVNSHADMTTRRTSPWPPHVAQALDQMIAAHQLLDWRAPTCGTMKP